MSITKNPIIIDPTPRLNSKRNIMSANENQKEPTVNKENDIKSKTHPENQENKTKKNTSNPLFLFFLIFLSLILISFTILMIGYFYFDWFKKNRI